MLWQTPITAPIIPTGGIERLPELVMQIEGLDSTPDLGYSYGKELIKCNVPFTAMVGRIAAKAVVGLIDGQEEYVQEIAVEPKLVVRG